MHQNSVLSAVLFIFGMSLSVDAFSFDNFIDPLLRDEEELKLEDQLSELGRVVDDAARNLFNLTIGASTTLSHANALLVIFILSAVIFAIFSLTYFAASSVFTGMNEENDLREELDLGEFLSSETANSAARLFLSYINSTTTISASYALVIILGISLALLALLGLAYMTASAIFTGTSVQSYYGKRSLPDGEETDLDLNWTRILQILHEMDEHFRRLGAEKSDDDCRKRLICRLFEKNNDGQNDSQRNLVKLTNELSDIYENSKLDTEGMDLKPSYDSMKAYHEANKNGQFGDCAIFYPRCGSY